jgi:ABC-type dipeptide/oligopeptide/nickel transport system ATPase component
VSGDPVVRIDGLAVEIGRRSPRTKVLHDVSLELKPGEMHALVGETGSGKSLTARTAIGLLPPEAEVTAGSVVVAGREVVGLDEDGMRALRGSVIGMVFQDARRALYPLRRVRDQMGSVLDLYAPGSDKAARLARVHELLSQVGIHDPERVARSYPHQLSGGMAQRVMIATVLIAEPQVVIADEPTTGLDATVQRQILELLSELQSRLEVAVLMITHDLTVVAQYCQTVSVMHQGRSVESGPVRTVLARPQQAYTRRLIEASKLTAVRHHERVVR